MGGLCLAALCSSQFSKAVGVWLGLGVFLLLGSRAAVSCCHGRAAGCAVIHHLLLWHLQEQHAALMLLVWQQWMELGEQSKTPSPSSLC